jgi:hypothetical protein
VAVHSTSLIAASGLAAGATTLYTVPTGKRTIVKSVRMINGGAAAARVVLSRNGTGGVLGYWIAHLAAANAAGEDIELATWVVMNAGETLKLIAGGTTTALMVSGSELTL